MNPIGKKNIAREFLILSIILVLGMFFLFGTFCFNWIKKYQYTKTVNQILIVKNISDSLIKQFNAKTLNGKDYLSIVYKTVKENYIPSLEELEYGKKFISEAEFRKLMLSDSLYQDRIYKFLTEKIDGFSRTKEEFFQLVRLQLDSTDTQNKRKADILVNEINQLDIKKKLFHSSFLTVREQLIKTLIFLFVLCTIGFIFRYFIYGIKWSIKTLRE